MFDSGTQAPETEPWAGSAHRQGQKLPEDQTETHDAFQGLDLELGLEVYSPGEADQKEVKIC